MLTLIAAVSENNVIGKNNDLLWHLPNDFKRFKKLTTRHPIIMGRKTFESLPGILPNREHIIITKQNKLEIKNCIVVNSLKEAVEKAYSIDKQPFVIGGGEIYKQALEIADKLEITRVHTSIKGDTYFPKIDKKVWKLISEELHQKDTKHKFNFSFRTYLKN